jgi:hypothetical protein
MDSRDYELPIQRVVLNRRGDGESINPTSLSRDSQPMRVYNILDEGRNGHDVYPSTRW